MTKRILSCALLVTCGSILLTGCMPKMTIDDLKQMRPQRPAELEQLNDFVGKWESTGEATMAGLDEVLKSSGTSEAKWAGDGWYLIEQGTFHMDELGDMQGMAIYTYDAKAKKYRTTWVDSYGTLGVGTGRYDEKTKTWHMKSTNHTPFGKTKMTSEARWVDDDTMDWTMTEYMMGGLIKTMEMKGTAKRK